MIWWCFNKPSLSSYLAVLDAATKGNHYINSCLRYLYIAAFSLLCKILMNWKMLEINVDFGPKSEVRNCWTEVMMHMTKNWVYLFIYFWWLSIMHLNEVLLITLSCTDGGSYVVELECFIDLFIAICLVSYDLINMLLI